MGADGGQVAARRRPGERGCRGEIAQLFQRAERQRQERRAGLLLAGAGGLAERAHRLRKERHLGPGGEHGRRVIEGPRRLAGGQRPHPQAARQGGEVPARGRVRTGDSGSGAGKPPGLARGEGAERMQRSRPRALAPRGRERRQPERARQVRHELPASHLEAVADFSHRAVGDRQQDQIHLAQRRRAPAAAPVPPGAHLHSGRRQRLEEGPRHRAAPQDCGGADHSRRNSTPASPAQASSVSPARTRPARISSASGDSTSRWMTWRMGRAPRAAWCPPAAIR
jgi:hypothetical protein